MLKLNKKAVGSDDFIPWLFMIIVAVFGIFFFAMYQANEVKAEYSQLKLYKNHIEDQKILYALLQADSAPFDETGITSRAGEYLSLAYSQDFSSENTEALSYLSFRDYATIQLTKLNKKYIWFRVSAVKHGEETLWFGLTEGSFSPASSSQEETESAKAYLPAIEKDTYLIVKLFTGQT